MLSKPKLLVSACLLGQETRYNGAHKYCSALFDGAFSAFELLSICPEVEIGLGIPRPPINLYQKQNRIDIIVENEQGENITEKLRTFCQAYLAQAPNFCGVVLKKNSPSCGPSGVKLYHATASTLTATDDGVGEFAYQLQRFLRHSQLSIPVIDEAALEQADLKQDFIDRARAYWRTQMKR